MGTSTYSGQPGDVVDDEESPQEIKNAAKITNAKILIPILHFH